MSDLLNKSLFNVLNTLDQTDRDQLWVNTHNKVNKLAKAVLLALEPLDDVEIKKTGCYTAALNARKILEEACT